MDQNLKKLINLVDKKHKDAKLEYDKVLYTKEQSLFACAKLAAISDITKDIKKWVKDVESKASKNS